MRTAIRTSGQLGPLLKHLRVERGLSQDALGKKIGLSQERISKIENHPERVTFDQILTVLMALGVNLTVEPREPLAQSGPAGKRTAGKAPDDEESW